MLTVYLFLPPNIVFPFVPRKAPVKPPPPLCLFLVLLRHSVRIIFLACGIASFRSAPSLPGRFSGCPSLPPRISLFFPGVMCSPPRPSFSFHGILFSVRDSSGAYLSPWNALPSFYLRCSLKSRGSLIIPSLTYVPLCPRSLLLLYS